MGTIPKCKVTQSVFRQPSGVTVPPKPFLPANAKRVFLQLQLTSALNGPTQAFVAVKFRGTIDVNLNTGIQGTLILPLGEKVQFKNPSPVDALYMYAPDDITVSVIEGLTI